MKQIIDGKEISTASIYDPNNGLVAQIDGATRAQSIIDYAHHEIHSGSGFVYCENNTLGTSAERNILIVTPNTTKWAHIVFQFRSSGEANYQLFESPTTTANGTSVTSSIFNRNRNSSNVPGLLMYHTPTVTNNGTRLCVKHFGAGQNDGGEDRGLNEWMLKQNTKYLIKVTSEAASNDISAEFDWYEHINQA